MGEIMSKEWWKEAVCYQIYPKSFYDSNHDGIGDIRGIINKLDYLSDLGVNIIWISPFFKSPMVDNGYDISDYYSVDPIFGTNEDLEELIEKAKKVGIKLLFDLVVNHCSDQHEWFQKAIFDPNCKERDYFVIRKKDQITNWRSIFGGSVWDKLPGSDDEYYMHVFAKEQPDLNWENPELRQEIYKMINYWLDKGIGGFRVDAIVYLKKNQDFPDFPSDGADGLASVNLGSQNQPGIDKFLTELRQETFDKYDCMTVGEAFGVPFEQLPEYSGDNGYFSMIFDFSYDVPDSNNDKPWYIKNAWTVDEWKEKVFKSQKMIQKFGIWSPNHLENHDSQRSVSRFFDRKEINYENTTMLGALDFFLRGTPFIYQGQELGMKHATIDDISKFDDIQTIDQYQVALKAGYSKDEALKAVLHRSRDNSRTPMQWDESEYAGFSTVSPWLPVNSDYKLFNVDSESRIENSVLNFYKKMIAIRQASEYQNTLVYGEMVPLYVSETNIVAYERKTSQQKLVIVCNFQNKKAQLPILEATNEMKIILSNVNNKSINKDAIHLLPYQFTLFEVKQ